jgi:Icc-related predicted phosphoesterase
LKRTFVLASDTHGLDLKTPAGDYLLFAGDCTKNGTEQEFVEFARWLARQPQSEKYITFGNSDRAAENDPTTIRQILNQAHCLIDEMSVVEGLKIYGSPWVVSDYDEIRARSHKWAFALMNSSERYRSKWTEIPEGLDVLLTHGPPYGISDRQTPSNKHVGDGYLLERLKQLAANGTAPKVHVFGHIHEGQKVTEKHGIEFFNASLLDRFSKPGKQAMTLTYDNGIWLSDR